MFLLFGHCWFTIVVCSLLWFVVIVVFFLCITFVVHWLFLLCWCIGWVGLLYVASKVEWRVLADLPLLCSSQTFTGDTIVRSVGAAGEAERVLRRGGDVVPARRDRQSRSPLLLEKIGIPPPVFFCSVEPASAAIENSWCALVQTTKCMGTMVVCVMWCVCMFVRIGARSLLLGERGPKSSCVCQ